MFLTKKHSPSLPYGPSVHGYLERPVNVTKYAVCYDLTAESTYQLMAITKVT